MGDINEPLNDGLGQFRLEIQRGDALNRHHLVFPRQQGRFHVPDQRLVTVVFHGFLGLYGLQNGKVAHLENGDPFKERVMIYCNYTGRYYIRLLKFMVENIEPPPVPDVPRNRGRVATRAVMTLVNRTRTLARIGGRQAAEPKPKMRDHLPVLRHDFPLLEHLNLKLNVLSLYGVAEDTIKDANKERERFTREILNKFKHIKDEDEKYLEQLKYIFQRLVTLVKRSDERVEAYYRLELKSQVLIAQKLRQQFDEHADDLVEFSFEPLVELCYRIRTAVEDFEFLTLKDKPHRITRDASGSSYVESMVRFLKLGHLNPFGEDQLVRRDPPPSIRELLDTAIDIATGT